MMTAEKEIRYVVEHVGVGTFRRGDVISSDQLHGCDIDRLLGLRSLRVASHLEWDQTHVDLPSEDRHLSLQHQLAEKDQTIQRLQERVSELEEEKANRQQNAISEVTRAQAPIFEEKDRTIADLRAKLADAASGQSDTHRNKPSSPAEQAAADLRAKLGDSKVQKPVGRPASQPA